MRSRKDREIARLKAQLADAHVKLRDANATVRTATGNVTRIAQTAVEQHDKLTAALADRDRQIEALQKQLDDALGYDTATEWQIEAGARWQDRRVDKRPMPGPEMAEQGEAAL